ncbi:MAG: hypothetical protein HZB18_05645 [Chloroflexi bacterium]|nr:hypothetical protein [Chloroflexota bacterium]
MPQIFWGILNEFVWLTCSAFCRLGRGQRVLIIFGSTAFNGKTITNKKIRRELRQFSNQFAKICIGQITVEQKTFTTETLSHGVSPLFFSVASCLRGSKNVQPIAGYYTICENSRNSRQKVCCLKFNPARNGRALFF